MSNTATNANPPPRRTKTNTPGSAPPSIEALNKAHAAACDQYRKPATTKKTYDGYLARGLKFVKALASARRAADEDGGIDHDDNIDIDLLEKAFDDPPNKHTLMALENFITQKCFHEGNGEATVNGIYSAFCDYWDHMGSHGVWAGDYKYNPDDDTFKGNPARAPSIRDLVKAVKIRGKEEGEDRVHARALRRPELKTIMDFSERVFPSKAARHRPKNDEERLLAMKELEMRAMCPTGFYVWTRNFELMGLRARHITRDCIGPGPNYHPHIKVLVEDRKGMQGKTGHDGPLETKQYNVYPEPKAPEMDMYDHLLRWLDYLERDIGRPLEPNEFIFPFIAANGTVHLNREMKLPHVQKLINGFTLRAGLKKYYSTHCFRRGGAQYRFMDAPMVERWSLRAVRWWGAWKDNESVEMLMKYLFDSLQSYETSYGDQACPSGPRETFMDNHKNAELATVQHLQDFTSNMITAVKAIVLGQQASCSTGPSHFPPVTANPAFPTLAPSYASTMGTQGSNLSPWTPTTVAAPYTASVYAASSSAYFVSPMTDPALAITNSTSSHFPIGGHIHAGPPSTAPFHFNPPNASQPFLPASNPALNPYFDHPFPYAGPSSNHVPSFNPSTYNTQPSVPHFPHPINSYAPPLGVPSPEALGSASQASAGASPLRPSSALNRCPSNSGSSPPQISCSIASIPCLDRRRGKGGWRQALDQWENADPQTGLALKDWPPFLYMGTQKVKVASKRNERRSIGLEYQRLGGTEQQFLAAHPDADTIPFSALVDKINVQNGSRGRRSKNGSPEERRSRR